jgi:hypothetical protein
LPGNRDDQWHETSETGADAMTDDFEIVRGSGNVFADFGDADAEIRKLTSTAWA